MPLFSSTVSLETGTKPVSSNKYRIIKASSCDIMLISAHTALKCVDRELTISILQPAHSLTECRNPCRHRHYSHCDLMVLEAPSLTWCKIWAPASYKQSSWGLLWRAVHFLASSRFWRLPASLGLWSLPSACITPPSAPIIACLCRPIIP